VEYDKCIEYGGIQPDLRRSGGASPETGGSGAPSKRTMTYARRAGLLIAIGIILVAAAARADDDVTQVLVPVVGTVPGIGGMSWRTEFAIVNDRRQSVDVILTLPTVGDEYLLAVTLQPGQVIHYPDLMGELFGLSGILAPLAVTVSGRRPLPIQTTVWGTMGTDMPRAQPIPVYYPTGPAPLLVLNDLSVTDDVRTNVGLGNVGTTAAEFVLALRRFEGRNVEIRRLVVPPNVLWQVPLQLLFPVLTEGNDLSLAIDVQSTGAYAYASVIANSTGEARFVQPGAEGAGVLEFMAPRSGMRIR
jgi:hypothetical protein